MKKAYVAPDAEFVTLIAEETVTKDDLSLNSFISGDTGVEDW